MPLPPIPAIKHWNPHSSSSAITLSTTVPASTRLYGQEIFFIHKVYVKLKENRQNDQAKNKKLCIKGYV